MSLSDQIREILQSAPPPGDPERVNYIYSRCGQLVGWITQPDTAFLADWLPAMSKNYGRYPMQIVEIGTFAGSTARGLITLTGGGNITCIDNFFDMNKDTLNGHQDGKSYWEYTIKNGGLDLSDFATLIIGESGEIGKTWTKPIDLLFVDGDHLYESAKQDINLYARHVIGGGYCMVDDYHMPDVAKAVDEYFTDKWELIRMPSKDPASIIVYKKLQKE